MKLLLGRSGPTAGLPAPTNSVLFALAVAMLVLAGVLGWVPEASLRLLVAAILAGFGLLAVGGLVATLAPSPALALIRRRSFRGRPVR